MSENKLLCRISVGAFLIYLPMQLLMPFASGQDACVTMASPATANVVQAVAALGSLGAILAAIWGANHQASSALQMQRDGAADAISLRSEAIEHVLTVAKSVICSFNPENDEAIKRTGHSRATFQAQGVESLRAGAAALKKFPIESLSCGEEHLNWMCAIGDSEELSGRLAAQVANGALNDPVVGRLMDGLKKAATDLAALAELKRLGAPLKLARPGDGS